jgi:hypothetical protein
MDGSARSFRHSEIFSDGLEFKKRIDASSDSPYTSIVVIVGVWRSSNQCLAKVGSHPPSDLVQVTLWDAVLL